MTPIQTAVLADLREAFGITPTAVIPVAGGYLNRKFRIASDNGIYLLKLYSPTRYPAHKLPRLEAALKRQQIFREAGGSCPCVYTVDGSPIRRVPTALPGISGLSESGSDRLEIAYMLMSYEAGDIPAPQTVTAEQMQSLGAECAHMHNVWADMDPASDPYYPLSPASAVQRLKEHLRVLHNTDSPDFTLPPDTDRIIASLDEPFFADLERGFCHEDLSADNLLMTEGHATLIDFDRGQYSYPLHDVGRAILSLAFDGASLRRPLVQAFAEGYRVYRNLSEKQLADALRVTFACEFPWWINREAMLMTEPKIYRFVKEMKYLMANWDFIPELIQGV